MHVEKRRGWRALGGAKGTDSVVDMRESTFNKKEKKLKIYIQAATAASTSRMTLNQGNTHTHGFRGLFTIVLLIKD